MEQNSREGTLRRALPVSVLLGLVAAVLGTALHGRILYQEDGMSGLPLGALAALVLSGAAAVFAGVLYRRPVMSAVAGAVTYLVLGAFSMDIFGGPLIVTGTSSDQTLPITVAGQIWLFGQAVATLAAVVISAMVLGRQRRADARAAAVPAWQGGSSPSAQGSGDLRP